MTRRTAGDERHWLTLAITVKTIKSVECRTVAADQCDRHGVELTALDRVYSCSSCCCQCHRAAMLL